MHRRPSAAFRLALPLLALIVAVVSSASWGGAAGAAPPAAVKRTEHAACPGPVPRGYARCFAHILDTSSAVQPANPGHSKKTTTTTTAAPTTTTTAAPTTTTTAAPTTTTTAAPTTTTTTASTTTTTAAPGTLGCTSHASAPSGYWPCDLENAYNLPSAMAGPAQTVAIVDAYDDPNVESDLGVYRSQFGLPPCTTANGCFRKVNQSGVQGSYPAPNTGWAQEISLDVDMVSAVCPGCDILLVEATTSSLVNLGAAENEAVALGADEISNSYGTSECARTCIASSYGAPYDHPGIAITVSAGDGGYGVEFPASSNHVTAVGGTSLTRDGSARGWSETVWDKTGSGCSQVFAKPSWQTDAGCSNRTVVDVSAVADPNTGVAVYDTYGGTSWLVFGGTSVGSPMIAAVYALAGNAAQAVGTPPAVPASDAYANPTSLWDITSGSNGSCGGSYLCTAGNGYDGPTGMGTPDGLNGF